MDIPQGYKQTELGIIPEDWEVITVCDVLDMPTKTTPTSSFNHEYYVGTENMYSGKRGVSLYTGELPYSQVREYLYNDILTSNIRPYLKKIWLANRCGGCSSDVIVFRVKDIGAYDPGYIYTVLSDDMFFKYSMDNAIGTKMPRGDKAAIKAYIFIVPKSLAEQQTIAETLSDIDRLIAALDKRIAKKRLIKQGAMQQLLTGKTRLPGFTEPWVEKKLGAISHIKTGSCNGDQAVDNGKYPFFVRSQKVYAIDSYSYDGEAILVPGEGGIGNIFHYINGKFDYHQRVYKISDFADDVCGKYIFFYMLRYFGEYALSLSVKATVDSLRLPTFEEFVICLPMDIKEQQAIAAILSDMDKEIADLEAKRDKYHLLKSGMMQKLLTGQIRLKPNRI